MPLMSPEPDSVIALPPGMKETHGAIALDQRACNALSRTSQALAYLYAHERENLQQGAPGYDVAMDILNNFNAVILAENNPMASPQDIANCMISAAGIGVTYR